MLLALTSVYMNLDPMNLHLCLISAMHQQNAWQFVNMYVFVSFNNQPPENFSISRPMNRSNKRQKKTFARKVEAMPSEGA